MRLKWCKNGGSSRVKWWVWERFEMGKTMNSHENLRENWKGSKTEPFCAKHAIFAIESSRVQVAKTSRQNTWKKTFEKFSKCFLWLEVPFAKESRTEPQKSLCTPCDWTLHPRTSRQPKPRKAWNSKFLKNSLSLFPDWSIYPPMSC